MVIRNRYVGAGTYSSARRKLDLDSSESKTCFSRAKLMDNLRSLAKSHGLSDYPTTRMRSKRGRKRKLMVRQLQEDGTLAILLYQGKSSALDITIHGNDGKKLWTKVLGLDEETLRVCDVLAKWDGTDSESFEGFDIGSGPEWDATRRAFERSVDIFIAAIYDLIGNYPGPFCAFVCENSTKRITIPLMKKI